MSRTFLRLVIPEPGNGTPPPPCTSEEPELFFPTSYGDDYRHQIAEAKAVCRRCPIATKINCLEFALDTGDKHAVLGGTTPPERDVIHRKRAAKAERDAARAERKLKAA